MSEVTEVVDAYFAAIKARDPDAVRAVFAPEGELVTAAGAVHGHDAIAAFYRDLAFHVEDLEPRPGPYVVEGDRVAVEIGLRMNGVVTTVADFFTVERGLVTRLAVYLGPNPA